MGIFARAGRLVERGAQRLVRGQKPKPTQGVRSKGNGNGPYRTSDGTPAIINPPPTPMVLSISPVPIAAGVEISMVTIPAGKFKMGSKKSDDEQPIRKVSLSGYAMGKDPITNAQWKAYLEVKGENVPYEIADKKKADHPVVKVNWHEANRFCEWLSQKTGRNIHLPTEAQWERAARGTAGREYPWGNDKYDPKKPQANFHSKGTVSVSDPLNRETPEGVRGLAGNVWEWCYDWYANYVASDVDNPSGPDKGNSRVLRGGSWLDSAGFLRVAYRFNYAPDFRFVNIGFRAAEDF
ncbi:MAG: formylglycine-generating enzyme family protein [bacterium]